MPFAKAYAGEFERESPPDRSDQAEAQRDVRTSETAGRNGRRRRSRRVPPARVAFRIGGNVSREARRFATAGYRLSRGCASGQRAADFGRRTIARSSRAGILNEENLRRPARADTGVRLPERPTRPDRGRKGSTDKCRTAARDGRFGCKRNREPLPSQTLQSPTTLAVSWLIPPKKLSTRKRDRRVEQPYIIVYVVQMKRRRIRKSTLLRILHATFDLSENDAHNE